MDGMTLECRQDPGEPQKQILTLGGDVTIAEAARLKGAVVAALGGGKELLVDLRAVTGIDLAGLQILEAAHRSALGSGKLFRIDAKGNLAFSEAVAGAGMKRHVGCARDLAGTCIWAQGEL